MTTAARPGSTSPRNIVEVLAFLVAPTTITVHVGSSTYTREAAAAGVQSQIFPLAVGSVSATMERLGATITASSAYPVMARPAVQDLQYYFTGSAR